MSACWDLLLNECCCQTLSTISQSTVSHCWPSSVHCSKSISVMCCSSASLEVSSHQNSHWASHLVSRYSLGAWLHFTCLLPSFIGHWSHLFMGQGSLCMHSPHHFTVTRLVYPSWTNCSAQNLLASSDTPGSSLPPSISSMCSLLIQNTLTPTSFFFLLTSYSLEPQLNPFLLETFLRSWRLVLPAHNFST